MTDATGWMTHPDFRAHNADLIHPERPQRLAAIETALDESDLLAELMPIRFGPATDEQIELVHTPDYLGRLDQMEGRYFDPDTFIGPRSPEIARLAAGGVIAAARAVWSGECANAFCAPRPPGHHALPDRAMGFCLLNNVAIASRAIQSENPGAKMFILDWDVHHGNGTQAIFYQDPTVLYASCHQFPFYPGTGDARETGSGDGLGTTVNVPLRAGMGDAEFLDAIDRILNDHALAFKPDMVFISCGFDAHHRDPLAELRVTTEAFGKATRRVCEFATSAFGSKVVSVLEGGYDLEALASASVAHVRELRAAASRNEDSQ